ncbi:MAG: hypothetical protein KIT60_16370 [Burkholderiaceae bacterium]|nr:hypothetical protein [Burkholderiaceae bacterium]
MVVAPIRLAVLALFGTTMASSVWADSVASSASSAGSASLGSISDSIGNSSRSSSPDNRTADGDYRVIEVAELAGKPGMLQLTLQATQGETHEFTLKLPREALGARGIAVGDVVHARNRPYGLEFARLNDARTREAFFLVLADDWHKELDSRPLSL